VVYPDRQLGIFKSLADAFLLAKHGRVERVRKVQAGIIRDLILLPNTHDMLSACVQKNSPDKLGVAGRHNHKLEFARRRRNQVP